MRIVRAFAATLAFVMLMECDSAVIVDMAVSAVLMCGRSPVMSERHAKTRADRRHPLDGNGQNNDQHNQRAEQVWGHRFGVYNSSVTPRHRAGSRLPRRWEHPVSPSAPRSLGAETSHRSAGEAASPLRQATRSARPCMHRRHAGRQGRAACRPRRSCRRR